MDINTNKILYISLCSWMVKDLPLSSLVAVSLSCRMFGDGSREQAEKPDPVLLVGNENGVVHVYELPCETTGASCELQCIRTLETKGGPIQAMAVADVTRLGTRDLVVSDSHGMVTLFSNQQILERRSVSQHCIECLQLQQHPLNTLSIIVGDTQGHLCSFSPYSENWRIRLADSKQNKKLMLSPHLQTLLAVDLQSQQKQLSSYTLAADNAKQLYFIQEGSIVLVLKTPAVVTAMCAGKFIDVSEIDTSSQNGSSQQTASIQDTTSASHACETQVALGTNTGAIYIMTNFEISQEEYTSVQLPITQLVRLPTAHKYGTDTLAVTGQFNAVHLIRDGKVTERHQTPAWVTCMTMTEMATGASSLVVGCADNSIIATDTS